MSTCGRAVPWLGLLVAYLAALSVGCSEQTDLAPQPPVAVCSGCLCGDPAWSCTDDTWLAADGAAVGLGPEAGFFEIEAVCFQFLGDSRCTEPARLFYSFQPADEAPAEQPVVVFFNGGPNFATTAGLFAQNTAPITLLEGAAATNPDSWTSLGNLLYVDARHSGLSYARATAAEPVPSADFVPELDAADILRVVLRFLARHPLLQDNRVVIVAESYGGVRAAALLDLLLHAPELSDPQARYYDPALRDEIDRHGAASWSGGSAPADVAQQFSHLVLIQPVVARQLQFDKQAEMGPFPGCLPAGYEPYKCDEPAWDDHCFGTTTAALLQPANLSAAAGADVLSIDWLGPAARADAVRLEDTLGCSADQPPDELVAALGALSAADGYFRLWVNLVNEVAWSSYYGRELLTNTLHVETFITHAALDARIWAPAIPLVLEEYDELVAGVEHDTAPRPGVARPGRMHIHYQPEEVGSEGVSREIRFPYYATSGHMVSAYQPAALLADVRQWMNEASENVP